jgi:ribosomal protein S9
MVKLNKRPISTGLVRKNNAYAYVMVFNKNDIDEPILSINGSIAKLKQMQKICLPFEIIASNKNIFLNVAVKGGLLNDQIEATRLAVLRALSKL